MKCYLHAWVGGCTTLRLISFIVAYHLRITETRLDLSSPKCVCCSDKGKLLPSLECMLFCQLVFSLLKRKIEKILVLLFSSLLSFFPETMQVNVFDFLKAHAFFTLIHTIIFWKKWKMLPLHKPFSFLSFVTGLLIKFTIKK